MYKGPEQKLIGWVTDKLDRWREHRHTNYDDRWREYERLWRGIWAIEDKNKQSERAKIISPAIQQAIETVQAEIEEAVFGNGKEWFDIEDDPQDQDKRDIILLKQSLQTAFKKDKIKKYTSQIITLGHVYGTGVGELQIKEKVDLQPDQEEIPNTGLTAIGRRSKERVAVELKPIVPFNFIIDPNALDIEDAMGCAVEEYVSIHVVLEAMEKGVYKEVDLSGEPSTDDRLERTQEQEDYQDGRVKLKRYYGLVPKQLLDEYSTDSTTESSEEDERDLDNALSDEYEAIGNDPEYEDLVEAVVVIANDCYILRAVENPYMMEDRPFVIYRPDVIPGRFWGRGTAEKGYNMQKALDGQIRAHLDHIGLTAAPMMGIDSTRMPKGFKFSVQPGKSVLTNGPPREILEPMTFGQANPVNIETAQLFERFLLQATGTLDAAGMPQQVSQQTDQGAMAMSLAGLIKKNKRALLNFNEDFLIPMVQKIAWRYMQFSKDQRFPAKDLNFIIKSNMGVMAREYEQQQYIGLMQTLGPDSPITPMLMAAIVDNSGLSDKDVLAEQLRKMSQPDPEAQKRQQEQEMLAKREVMARIAEQEAKALKAQREAEVVPLLAKAKYIAALSNNLNEDNESKDFERRMRLMEASYKERDLNLKQMDIESNERIAQLQASTKSAEVQTKAVIETMKVERDKEGNIKVTKSKE